MKESTQVGKKKHVVPKRDIRHQLKGDKERKHVAYSNYDERLNDEGNESNGALGRVLVGVDEAGRGPLAGPVAVGIAVVPCDFDWNLIPGVEDSKKVSPKNREAIFRCAQKMKKEGKLDFAVTLISSSTIDRTTITKAVAVGIGRCFKKLNLDPKTVDVRLDGLLKAPHEYTNQKTIIKGDAKEKVIGLASIIAKVTRDRTLVRVARDYPKYGFEIHKGYGTLTHRNAIKKHGLSPIHRKTFCKRIIQK